MRVRQALWRVLACLILFLSTVNAWANELKSESDIPGVTRPARVGVVMMMPFGQVKQGHYSGIAVDIWERIAAENHWTYTYVPLGQNGESNVRLLATTDKLDLIISPATATKLELEYVDLSRPYYLSSIGVMTKKHEVNLKDILLMLFSKNLLHVLLLLVGVFVAYQALLWMFERKATPDIQQKTSYYAGVTKSVWLHLFQKKVDYMPQTAQGRLIGIFWILFAAMTFTIINANFTSALTIARYESSSSTSTLAGLQSDKIAGIKGRYAVKVAQDDGIEVQQVENLETAAAMLESGEVDGVVCETPAGTYYINHNGHKNLTMSSYVLTSNLLSFPLKKNSPLRAAIDLGIVELQENDTVLSICRKYVGDDASRCNL